MLTKRCGSAVALAILFPVLLCGCSPASPKPGLAANVPLAKPASIQARPAAPRIFTLDTPVYRIAADPQGKAVLDRDIPGLMANKNYPLFDDMSLSQIALVSGGRLTKSKLDLVKSDLVQISYLPPVSEAAVIQPGQ